VVNVFAVKFHHRDTEHHRGYTEKYPFSDNLFKAGKVK
jgi:hypothetical protein